MISIFQSKHLEMAEASERHAENIRENFNAIRDVNSTLSSLTEDNDENGSSVLERLSDCKNDLLSQLGNARESEIWTLFESL
jgi:hypothetical protein